MPYWRTSAARHLLERDDRVGPALLEAGGHAAHDVALGVQADDRVAERDDERLVADERPGAEHRVAEAERLPLARVEVLHGGALELQFAEQVFLAGLAQRSESARRSGRSGSRSTPCPGPVMNSTRVMPTRRQFLDDVLHDRLAADRQHLLGLRLGGRQQSRAETGDRDDGDFDAHKQEPGRDLRLGRGARPRAYRIRCCAVTAARAAGPVPATASGGRPAGSE